MAAKRSADDKGTVVTRSVTPPPGWFGHLPQGSPHRHPRIRLHAAIRGAMPRSTPAIRVYVTLPAAEFARDLSGVPHQQGSPSKVIPSNEIDVLNGSNGNDNSGDPREGEVRAP